MHVTLILTQLAGPTGETSAPGERPCLLELSCPCCARPVGLLDGLDHLLVDHQLSPQSTAVWLAASAELGTQVGVSLGGEVVMRTIRPDRTRGRLGAR